MYFRHHTPGAAHSLPFATQSIRHHARRLSRPRSGTGRAGGWNLEASSSRHSVAHHAGRLGGRGISQLSPGGEIRPPPRVVCGRGAGLASCQPRGQVNGWPGTVLKLTRARTERLHGSPRTAIRANERWQKLRRVGQAVFADGLFFATLRRARLPAVAVADKDDVLRNPLVRGE